MKRIALAMLIAFVTLMTITLVIGLFLPTTWAIRATTVISAPPHTVYPWVSQMKRWPEWTPWNESMDPTLKRTFEGADGAVGFTTRWTSEQVGSGWMRITAIEADRSIAYDLAFDRMPEPAHGVITLEPTGSATRVTWTDHGSVGSSFVARYFVPMIQKAVAADFDKGLATLKQKIESPAPTPPPSPQ
jgi:uncharacterized protein YndB with AHSA1/START domain